MFWCFEEPFSRRLQKVAQFVKKHEKSSIWQKLCNVLKKVPCLCILINFLLKSCKKCLISWKNTKNHRFGQNLQLLEQTTMSWYFHELFRKKLQKVFHFVKKHDKSSIWPKLCDFFEQTTMIWCFDELFSKKLQKLLNSWKSTKNHRFGQNLQLFEQTTRSWHFRELFRRKLQKVPHFVKKHEKPSVWPKLATFRANYDVLAFSWVFQKEIEKSASFGEKAREIIDFAKTCNFSKKLPCFDVSINFMAKTCKNCLISRKSMKTHRFGKNYATLSNKLPCFDV